MSTLEGIHTTAGLSSTDLATAATRTALSAAASARVALEKELMICVSHRGLHHTDDKTTRPMENTTSAYLGAWCMGFTHCECDITVSADGTLFLCHDATWERLICDASRSAHPELASTPVCQLAWSVQRDQVRLLDGHSAPSTLEDVLSCARNLGPSKRLVIELKKDEAWERVLAQLQRFLSERAELARHVSVIMSFDKEMVSRVSLWYATTLREQAGDGRIRFLYLTEAPAHFCADGSTECANVASYKDFVVSVSRLIQGTQLDGVYLEWQDEMKSDVNARAVLAQLCEKMTVGVWGYADEQPDGLSVLPEMRELGLSFLNTDLPLSLL